MGCMGYLAAFLASAWNSVERLLYSPTPRVRRACPAHAAWRRLVATQGKERGARLAFNAVSAALIALSLKRTENITSETSALSPWTAKSSHLESAC